MEIKICVCGAGTMGSGIALTIAQAGNQVVLFEKAKPALHKAEFDIHKTLSALVNKGKISEQQKITIVSNIKFVSELEFCIADICIEAITEKKQPKIDLFKNLARINSNESIFATNTSSLSVTEIASELPYPERVVGLHFFNPATIMKLVEVVNTSFTSKEVLDKLLSFIKSLGKVAVTCNDSPGFIVNRVARPFYIEALKLIEETSISIEQADKLLESTGFKMGPFRLMDLIGNDINYAVSCSVYEQLGSPERLKPSPVQEKLVVANKLGRKTGEGYYQYEKQN